MLKSVFYLDNSICVVIYGRFATPNKPVVSSIVTSLDIGI